MLVTLADVLNLFELSALGPDTFEGTQPDPPNHHIVGGQIAAQALMAASRTVQGRHPHSLHVYFLRRGDARSPVRFEVARLRDGGTFSSRRISATQDGEVLMEGLASFTTGVVSAAYQRTMPSAPPPESLTPIEEQLAPYAEEFGGWWVDERPFDVRYVDPPPRIAMDSAEQAGPVSRIWLRARGVIPEDLVLNSCVLTLQSALTPVETTLGPMRKSQYDISALLDHTVWFHRPADFSDWLFYEQTSPAGVAGRALATGTIYNRAGDLVCSAAQEIYFPPPRV
ncbi:acyl-CoA thioesterase [Mycolicibacterium porcinum]|uniref:Thioesterase family protein n=1 Tax=Mycolicibacterium porcinum TaxID=39693 RepID=A0AAW5SZY6_9MYCO|nr:acyl-CoA thioesterase domain-containing protein [Mycolicibacterium porcinum]MCV7387983.1 thioesterase family protein [Mycolicibacterium porcinum]ORB43474.1 acyl-CoA thioesterase II [Mycolicibacterium porcinum]CDO31335.1 acyl-CoA thioesterase [Mycolicibacterium vulneris]